MVLAGVSTAVIKRQDQKQLVHFSLPVVVHYPGQKRKVEAWRWELLCESLSCRGHGGAPLKGWSSWLAQLDSLLTPGPRGGTTHSGLSRHVNH